MPGNEHQKIKLLYLMKILQEHTDESHGITLQQIQQELVRRGVTAERKSLYADMALLRDFGLDICVQRGRESCYRLMSRDFELAELKLLVDAVQSARFISRKKSLALIKKLEGLTSTHKSRQLQRQVFVLGRVKTMNESVCDTVDTLHDAIARGVKVSFQYYEYTVHKQRRFRRDGHRYVVSPVALTWANENYYLIAKYTHEDFTHFRVDKIARIAILSERCEARCGDFNLAAYVEKTFSMFAGADQAVTVRFSCDLIGTVIDRFGQDVLIEQTDGETFTARMRAAVSPPFLSWVFQFGDKARILSPPEVVTAMEDLLRQAAGRYAG